MVHSSVPLLEVSLLEAIGPTAEVLLRWFRVGLVSVGSGGIGRNVW